MNANKEIIIEARKLKKSFPTGDTHQTIFENSTFLFIKEISPSSWAAPAQASLL